jgi:hypothetical protein
MFSINVPIQDIEHMPPPFKRAATTETVTRLTVMNDILNQVSICDQLKRLLTNIGVPISVKHRLLSLMLP